MSLLEHFPHKAYSKFASVNQEECQKVSFQHETLFWLTVDHLQNQIVEFH